MTAQHQILQESGNTLIIAISDTAIGKVILPSKAVFVDMITKEPVSFLNEKPNAIDEAAALTYANSINDLMPKYITMDTWLTEQNDSYDMIIMERLYPLPIYHFDLSTREKMIEAFESKLKELHRNNFVHGDLMRPTNYFTRGNYEWMFSNVVQTETGLRLVDAGFGTILSKDNIREFLHIKFREEQEITYFREYYLSEK